jgi:Family of unknown function (DUF5361)
VGRVRRNRTVGIVALVGILKDHWGAVGRDLITAGYIWDDVGSERLPMDQFVSFVVFAPPGTAVFHEHNKGWTTTDYLIAQSVDALHYLAWTKTEDAHKKFPQHRPEPIYRPGMTFVRPAPSERAMTASEYAEKAGIQMNWEED